jgi:cytochrome c biogenesis factor
MNSVTSVRGTPNNLAIVVSKSAGGFHHLTSHHAFATSILSWSIFLTAVVLLILRSAKYRYRRGAETHVSEGDGSTSSTRADAIAAGVLFVDVFVFVP